MPCAFADRLPRYSGSSTMLKMLLTGLGVVLLGTVPIQAATPTTRHLTLDRGQGLAYEPTRDLGACQAWLRTHQDELAQAVDRNLTVFNLTQELLDTGIRMSLEKTNGIYCQRDLPGIGAYGVVAALQVEFRGEESYPAIERGPFENREECLQALGNQDIRYRDEITAKVEEFNHTMETFGLELRAELDEGSALHCKGSMAAFREEVREAMRREWEEGSMGKKSGNYPAISTMVSLLPGLMGASLGGLPGFLCGFSLGETAYAGFWTVSNVLGVVDEHRANKTSMRKFFIDPPPVTFSGDGQCKLR